MKHVFQVLYKCRENRETGESPVRSRHCKQRRVCCHW